MNYSIFQEVPDEIDESWTHGFLVGGMATNDIQSVASAYKLAGDTLLQEALSGGAACEFCYPIIFTYRHCIELYLKTILQPQRPTHNLEALAQDLEDYCLQHYNQPLPNWFKAVILEFDEFDSRSTTFRYDSKVTSKNSGNIDERWIDLPLLQRTMNKLQKAFEWLIQGKAAS